ncbi:MAG: hypothetical protein K9W44_00775 [Candidatus Lokiarchaeota archaeon]|nr:hypothetical protein [Candidatus Harpocratesius repetitus]
MTIEMKTTTLSDICPKCGSKMVLRRRIAHNRPVQILQCRVCRHYEVIDEDN